MNSSDRGLALKRFLASESVMSSPQKEYERDKDVIEISRGEEERTVVHDVHPQTAMPDNFRLAADDLDEAAGQGGDSYKFMAGLLAGYGLLCLGNGLLQTIVPLRLLQVGSSVFVIGLVQSCYYIGFILGAGFSRRLIERVGQHRTFVALCAAASLLALAFGMTPHPAILALIRLMTGFAFIGLFASIESWLNTVARSKRRGRIFSFYVAVSYLCVGMGQFLVDVGDASGTLQLSLVAGLFAAAIIPVSLLEGWPTRISGSSKPKSDLTWRATLKLMAASSPLAIPGAISIGVIYSSYYSMTPLVLVQKNFTTAEISMFMGITSVVALLLQWPIGRLSDSIDRRRVIYCIALLSLILSVALLIIKQGVVTWLIMLFYASVTFSQYGLVVTHVNDHIEADHRIAVSTMLLALISVGGVAGPMIVSVLTNCIGPSGLFVCNATVCGVLASFAVRALRVDRKKSRIS
jgi:MFS family permease